MSCNILKTTIYAILSNVDQIATGITKTLTFRCSNCYDEHTTLTNHKTHQI